MVLKRPKVRFGGAAAPHRKGYGPVTHSGPKGTVVAPLRAVGTAEAGNTLMQGRVPGARALGRARGRPVVASLRAVGTAEAGQGSGHGPRAPGCCLSACGENCGGRECIGARMGFGSQGSGPGPAAPGCCLLARGGNRAGRKYVDARMGGRVPGLGAGAGGARWLPLCVRWERAKSWRRSARRAVVARYFTSSKV